MVARRDRIPGVSVDAERNINQATGDLDSRLRKLERKTGRAGIVSSDTAAKPGEFLNVEAPANGLTIIFPEPVPALRNERVTLCFRNTNAVRLVCIRGTVNRQTFVVNTNVGTFEAVCDGLDGWAVETGLSSTGSATDAEYLLGLARGSLPNGRLATDSTEIDVDLTVANVASWALKTASVGFSKLQNLTGLSVLGRAANSTGVMAAITAGTARHVLRANAALSSLEWGYPVQLGANGASTFDTFYLDFINSTYLTAGVGGSGTHGLVQYTFNVSTFLAAIDTNSIVVGAGGLTLERAAITGAIAIAQNANTSLFAGIQNNGSATTDRTNLNFIGFTVADDAANDRINITAPAAAEVIQTVAISAGDNHDVTVPAGVTILRVDAGNNDFRITGFVRAGGNFDGDTFKLMNASNSSSVGGLRSTADPATLSALANQIITPYNAERYGTRYCAHLSYDGTDSQWRILSESTVMANGVTDATLAATTSNLAIAATWCLRVTLSGAQTLTGMVPLADGHAVWIENVDNTDGLTIDHDATSTATNRFYCPLGQDFFVPPRTGIWARYNAALQRWILGYTKQFGGINVRNAPSLHTGIGTLDFAPGNGILYGTATSGAAPGIECDVQFSVDEAASFTWTGTHLFAEKASSPTVGAGNGMFWVQNQTPSRAVFTDDVEADWPLNVHGVASNTSIQSITNSTNLVTGASFTIPANTLRAGSTYQVVAQGVFTRGATATATSVRGIIIVNGTEVTATIVAGTVANPYGFEIRGTFTQLTTGVSGTCTYNVGLNMTTPAAGTGEFTGSTQSGTVVNNTTTTTTLAVGSRMGVAVANCTVAITNAYIMRVV